MKAFIALLSAALLITGCQPKKTDAMTDQHAFSQWAKQNAVALNSIDPQDPDYSNLKAIGQAIGDAKVVALSEGFHNCSEMMTLHHRIIRYLVEEKGFNTVVSESGLPESRTIHNYVLGEHAPENMWQDGLNKMYSQWIEGRALIKWMSEYNQDHKNTLHYYGSDIAGFYRDWRPPFKQLTDYLEQVDPSYAVKLKNAFLPTLEVMGSDARKQHQNALTPTQRTHLTLQLELAVTDIESQRDEYISASDKKSYDWALQTAVALQLANSYYHNYMHRLNPATSLYAGLSARELAMARNTMWAIDQRPNAKVIIINHVLHTKTASQYQGDLLGHFTPMGQLLKQQLGDQLHIIGMTYGGGKFWNKWQRPGEREVASIPAYEAGGIEAALKSVGHRQFFINFNNAPDNVQPWLQSTTTIRENDYALTIKPSEWDSCLYIDNVSPATAATKP